MRLRIKSTAKSQNFVIGAGILITILFIFGISSGIHLQLQGNLQVDVTPNDSTITINNHKVVQGKVIGVNQGTYTLKVSREGFATQSQKFTIKNRESKEIKIYLLSNSSIGDQWLNLHPEQATEIEGTGSRAYDKLSAQNTTKNPFVSELPIYDPRFRIDYGLSQEHPDDSNAVAIYITSSSPIGRQTALQSIRDNGYDPSDMEIIFEAPQQD